MDVRYHYIHNSHDVHSYEKQNRKNLLLLIHTKLGLGFQCSRQGLKAWCKFGECIRHQNNAVIAFSWQISFSFHFTGDSVTEQSITTNSMKTVWWHFAQLHKAFRRGNFLSCLLPLIYCMEDILLKSIKHLGEKISCHTFCLPYWCLLCHLLYCSNKTAENLHRTTPPTYLMLSCQLFWWLVYFLFLIFVQVTILLSIIWLYLLLSL